jgi:lipopolysaccharide export LptBFGC system permease protein LptF
MKRKLILGGLIIGILNLIFYLVISPKIFGKSTGLAMGGPLATSLAWIESSIFGTNRIFSGIPPIIWVLVPGIVVGAFASAIISKQSEWASFCKTKLKSGRIIRTGIGGILVGFGVMLANGCLIKHALSGLPGLSLESIVTLSGIIAGIWCTLKIEERSE